MKHFYEHQDDSTRSKLTEHEFEIPQGAWENMAGRLDALKDPSESTVTSWSAWFIIGSMFVATVTGLLLYQWQTPFGKNTNSIVVKGAKADRIASAKDNFSNSSQKNTNQKNTNEERTIAQLASTSKKQQYSNAAPLVNKAASINNTNQERSTRPTQANVPVHAGAKETKHTQPENHPITISKSVDKGKVLDSEVSPSNKNASTPKTIITRTFSESTLKWRNEHLPAISPNSALENTQKRLWTNTPVIILDDPYIEAPKTWNYGIQGGLNTKLYGKNRGFSITPTVGAFVQKEIDGRFAIQAEIEYKMLKKQSFKDLLGQNTKGQNIYLNLATEHSSNGENRIYEEHVAQVYELGTIHIVELPVSFLYKLNKKHQLGLGIKAAYLFSLKSENDIINTKSNKELGYNSLDFGALASYEYKIKECLALGIVYSLGFTNLAKGTIKLQEHYDGKIDNLYQFTPDQIITLENMTAEGDVILPISITEDERVFLRTTRDLKNTDLRILLRYYF